MVIPSIEVAGKPLPLLPKTKERARHEFQARTPTRQIERLKRMKEREGAYGITLQVRHERCTLLFSVVDRPLIF